MLTGYFDETGQAGDVSQKVNGMAGLIAPVNRWIEIENAWNEHIKDKQYKDYHDRLIRPKNRERRRKPLLDILEKFPVLPLGWLVSMDACRELPAFYQTVFGDPYYRAYNYCLSASCIFVSAEHTSEEEKVLTVFDRKRHSFQEKLFEYYELWKGSNPRTQRIVGEPVIRSANIPPMYAADMVAAILREEFERRLYNPINEPNESFKRIYKLAERVLTQSSGECWVDVDTPFQFLTTQDDLKDFIKPMMKELLKAYEEHKREN